MAIEAKQLMIGNWVIYHGEEDGDMPCKLDGQDIASIEQKKHYADMHSPIPLSSEVLEACGFVNVRDVHWCVPSNDASKAFEICVWSDHVSYTLPNHFHLKIKSLHQLQNLYFSQTETELTYNPSIQ